MAEFIVTAVDTTGIQRYIFGSNRLRENVGASELVRLATGEWALEAVKDVAGDGKHNVRNARTAEFDPDFRIEDCPHAEAAEIVYAGGGNAVVIFRTLDKARDFTCKLTRRVLEKAPGLSLVVAHDGFQWDHETQTGDRSLSLVVRQLVGVKLGARKASRLPSLPLLGLGVTAACESTGLVAVQTNGGEYDGVKLKLRDDEPTRLISRETRAKFVASERANEWLRSDDMFAPELGGWFDFPSSIDDLGRLKGEESYLAVVHADGNGMGKRIEAIGEQFPEPKDNRRYITKMRLFSQQLNKAGTEALRYTVGRLTRALRYAQKTNQELVASVLPLKYDRNKDRYLLPFRPLVFGGDDVTFVCNGQVGLSLAAAYLDAFERETERATELNGKMHACAGIAIVKMHYPFARAYELSEQLTRSAKQLGKPEKPSALDWHFATSGLSGSLEEIRRREYTVGSGSLSLRPVRLRPVANDQEGRAWFERIEPLIRVFQSDVVWSQKRNKVKALREALREGTKVVERFRLIYELDALPPLIPDVSNYRQTGWEGRQCGYFDAIELMDHYLSLEEGA